MSSYQYLCFVHICPGRRAINLSTIFRAVIFGHRRWLRATACMCSHCLRASGTSGASRGKSVQKTCAADCTEIVQSQWSCPCSLTSASRQVIIRSLCGFHAEAVRIWCGDRAVPPCRFWAWRPPSRCPCGDCAMPLTTCLRATDLRFFKFVKLPAKQNRRGSGARESVQKFHSRLLPPHGSLAEAARKGGYGQDTGSVDPSHAKCELGISIITTCRGIATFWFTSLKSQPQQTISTALLSLLLNYTLGQFHGKRITNQRFWALI